MLAVISAGSETRAERFATYRVTERGLVVAPHKWFLTPFSLPNDALTPTVSAELRFL
jgi:hypothetical protein